MVHIGSMILTNLFSVLLFNTFKSALVEKIDLCTLLFSPKVNSPVYVGRLPFFIPASSKASSVLYRLLISTSNPSFFCFPYNV